MSQRADRLSLSLVKHIVAADSPLIRRVKQLSTDAQVALVTT